MIGGRRGHSGCQNGVGLREVLQGRHDEKKCCQPLNSPWASFRSRQLLLSSARVRLAGWSSGYQTLRCGVVRCSVVRCRCVAGEARGFPCIQIGQSFEMISHFHLISRERRFQSSRVCRATGRSARSTCGMRLMSKRCPESGCHRAGLRRWHSFGPWPVHRLCGERETARSALSNTSICDML